MNVPALAAAPLPPTDDPAALMAAEMMGAPPELAGPPMDPVAGGMPPLAMGGDPALGMMPGAQFPTIDPEAMSQVLLGILEAQAQDREGFAMAQSEALQGNPLFAAILGAAPMPGAGMDGGAIGETTLLDPATESEAVGLPYA